MGNILSFLLPELELEVSLPVKPAQDRIREAFQGDSVKMVQLDVLARAFIDSLRDSDQQCLDLSRRGLKEIPNPHLKPRSCSDFNLSFNRLESLPDWLLQPPVSEFIQTLAMSHNRITATPPLHLLINLKKLDCSWNWFHSAEFISHLSKLEWFNFSHCSSLKSSLPNLSVLSNLRHLDISSCRLTSFPLDAPLPLLEFFNASVNEFAELPSTISGCTSLTTLDLSYNPFRALPPLEKLTNLTHANFQSTLITSFPIIPNSPLSFINFTLTKFPNFPTVLCSFPNLKTIEYVGNDASTIPIEIQQLSSLQTLSLRYNKIDSESIANITSIPSLTRLDLAANGLESLTPEIQKLQNLISLNLSYNKIGSLPKNELLTMTNLKDLHIDSNPLPKELIQSYFRKDGCSDLLNLLNSAPTVVPPPLAHVRLSKEEVTDKIYGLIFGQAIGDAIGLSSEFMNPKQACFHYSRDTISYSDIIQDNHRRRWYAGDYTDDTDQMILIIENLLANKGDTNKRDFGESLLRWAYEGFAELGDTAGMGIGSTVSAVLRHPVFLENPVQAATKVWVDGSYKAAANGAVMRTCVVGAAHYQDLERVIRNTVDYCTVTHVDPRAQASCVAATVAIVNMLNGVQDIDQITQASYEHAVKFLDPSLYTSMSGGEMNIATAQQMSKTHIAELKFHLNADLKELDLGEGSSIGYTFKCMGSGFAAIRSDDFVRTMIKIIHEAGDADTNAAVAGAMLGCKLGFKALPKEWMGLLHFDWLKAKADSFVDLVNTLSVEDK